MCGLHVSVVPPLRALRLGARHLLNTHTSQASSLRSHASRLVHFSLFFRHKFFSFFEFVVCAVFSTGFASQGEGRTQTERGQDEGRTDPGPRQDEPGNAACGRFVHQCRIGVQGKWSADPACFPWLGTGTPACGSGVVGRGKGKGVSFNS
jgi:hypothetical protein